MFTGKKIPPTNISNSKINTGKQINTKITNLINSNNNIIQNNNPKTNHSSIHIQQNQTQNQIKLTTNLNINTNTNANIQPKIKNSQKYINKKQQNKQQHKQQHQQDKSQDKKRKNTQSLINNPEISNNKSIPTPVTIIEQQIQQNQQEIPQHQLSGDQIFVDFNNQNYEDDDDFDEEQRVTPQPFFQSQIKLPTNQNAPILQEKENKNQKFQTKSDEEQDQEPSFIDPNDISQLGMNMEIFSLEVQDIMSKQYFVI